MISSLISKYFEIVWRIKKKLIYRKKNSIEVKNSFGQMENTYEIKETIYDFDLDYTNISKPFLAYGLNGSVTTVNCFWMLKIIFLINLN